jgi:hypothetical protein
VALTGLDNAGSSEDEKAFTRLKEMLQPLRAKYRIGLYPTRPLSDKKSLLELNPPPSFWNNEELRRYLRDASLARVPSAKSSSATSVRDMNELNPCSLAQRFYF